MGKFGVMVSEVLSRSIIVDADSYEEAEEKVIAAYEGGFLKFNRENSDNHLDEPKDDTGYYLSIFTEEEFNELPQDEDINRYSCII